MTSAPRHAREGLLRSVAALAVLVGLLVSFTSAATSDAARASTAAPDAEPARGVGSATTAAGRPSRGAEVTRDVTRDVTRETAPAALALPVRPTTLVVTSDPDVPAVEREVAVAKAQLEFDRMAAYWSDISNGTVEFELAQDIVWWPDNGTCRSNTAARDRVYAGARAVSGFTPGPLKHLIVNVGNCTNFGGWGGGSSLTSGGSLYIEDPKWQGVWTHEMGHTISFGHANMLVCTDGSIDAAIGAEPGADPDCRSEDYGDTLDTMAGSLQNTLKGFSAPNAIRSGFYDSSQYVVANGRAFDQTITISSRDVESGPIAVQVRDPRSDQVYYVELVARTEYDLGVHGSAGNTTVLDGVTYRRGYGLRVLRFEGDSNRTLLIPAPSNAAGERPSVWATGQTFTSAGEGASVEVIEQTATSATVRVRTFGQPVPEPAADSVTTPVNASVTIAVLDNDQPAPQSTLEPTSVVFPTTGQPTGAEVSNEGRTVNVPDEGDYTADPVTGVVTFVPVHAFTGPASPVTYRVTDANGETGTSTVAVTVVQAPPTAVDDQAATAYETAVDVDVLVNDLPPTEGALDPTSVLFTDDGQPAGATVGDQGRSLEVPGEGSYLADPVTGVISFAPDDGFDGEASPVTYQVSSVDGGPDEAVLTVTVGADTLAPTAADDLVTTPYQSAVEIRVADNDTAADGRTLDLGSVVLPDSADPDRTTLAVDGEGTYTVAGDGVVTFAPVNGFSGDATPVAYEIGDSQGAVATAQIRVTVGDGPQAPIAADDTVETPFATPAVVDVLANDTAGSGDTLDRGSVVFDDGTRTLTVAGQGTYAIDAETATITFTPVELFVGEAGDVTYRVSGTNGLVDIATLTVTVAEPEAPVAVDDYASTDIGRVIDLHILDNDTSPVDLRPETTTFPEVGQPVGSTVSGGGRTITVPDQGEYVIHTDVDGGVDFRPAPDFLGTATPVVYEVTDALGRTATARITVDVQAAPAVGVDDTFTTIQDRVFSVDPLANDTPSTGATFQPESLTLLADDGQNGRTARSGALAVAPVDILTVPGQGTWRVTDDQQVTFDPDPDFRGTSDPVAYEALDSAGQVAHADLVARVLGPRAAAADDRATTSQGDPVDVDVLANDRPSPREEWRVDSLTLGEDQPPGADADRAGTLAVPGQGRYTIDEGTITFTPVDAFVGTTAAVAYEVTDSLGEVRTATVTVVVTADDDPEPTDPDPGAPGSGDDDGGGGLPDTGGPPAALIVLGILLVLAGSALSLRARRRVT